MIITDPNEETLEVGSEITFTPDLDRSAIFSIEKIEGTEKKDWVTVFLKYLKGRWVPDNTANLFSLKVPIDFSIDDIECAWFGIPNIKRFTL